MTEMAVSQGSAQQWNSAGFSLRFPFANKSPSRLHLNELVRVKPSRSVIS